jgi:divalent metal cation (Fe/Co/Zn/Cd) transporter
MFRLKFESTTQCPEPQSNGLNRTPATPSFRRSIPLFLNVTIISWCRAMPILSRAKKKVGAALGSAAMSADAKQTDFCVYLSMILLAGLVLNAILGWWWADPVSAIIMAPIIAREGLEGVTGCDCCGA